MVQYLDHEGTPVPFEGAWVFFRDEQGVQLQALVVHVEDDQKTANLTVFRKNGETEPRLGVKFGNEPGNWNLERD